MFFWERNRPSPPEWHCLELFGRCDGGTALWTGKKGGWLQQCPSRGPTPRERWEAGGGPCFHSSPQWTCRPAASCFTLPFVMPVWAVNVAWLSTSPGGVKEFDTSSHGYVIIDAAGGSPAPLPPLWLSLRELVNQSFFRTQWCSHRHPSQGRGVRACWFLPLPPSLPLYSPPLDFILLRWAALLGQLAPWCTATPPCASTSGTLRARRARGGETRH